jgi:hypothetical protein
MAETEHTPQVDIWIKAGALAGLLLFAVGLGVHVMTFMPGFYVSTAQVWPLHLLSLGVLGYAAVLVFGTKPFKARAHPARAAVLRERRRVMWESIPGPVKALQAVVVLYAVAAYLFFLVNVEGGVFAENGTYFLGRPDDVVRELTREEYRRFQMLNVRAYSGLWLAFTLGAAVLLAYCYPALRRLGRRM